MSAKWIPDDDELDGLARSTSSADPDAAKVEHARTSLLAQAATLRQQPRQSAAPLMIGIGAALAAAAAVVIWLVAAPSEHARSKENIAAIGLSSFHRVSDWPDYAIAVDEGQLAIEVASLDDGERFRVMTTDAVVEVHATKLVVGANRGHLTSVRVSEGRVEIRVAGNPPMFLAAGESWTSPITAKTDELVVPPAAAAVPEPPVAVRAPSSTERTHRPTRVATEPSTSIPVPVTPPPRLLAATPGELEFRTGVAALRAGDAAIATKSFAAACTAARGNALAEDACFWFGAAAKRAGQTAVAREALTSFGQRFPTSGRAGEAAALLGWILYDAGELGAAEAKFRGAANDRVPKVKESAERGLAAITRKRSTAP
ncbi:MAG: hypothetical protein ABI867_34445 [Kofleriaceae bacterium]